MKIYKNKACITVVLYCVAAFPVDFYERIVSVKSFALNFRTIIRRLQFNWKLWKPINNIVCDTWKNNADDVCKWLCNKKERKQPIKAAYFPLICSKFFSIQPFKKRLCMYPIPARHLNEPKRAIRCEHPVHGLIPDL